MLLCVGVLIIGWTIRTVADSQSGSLVVTATVEAPAPSQPATIVSPVDQEHFTNPSITVSGSCLPNTYVELYQNGSFAGMANCGPGVSSYQIGTDISPGANDLYVRIFSTTNNEGPPSPHITVYYDVPPTPAPAAPTQVPTTLAVTTEDGVPYSAGSLPEVGQYPTIDGLAPPGSKVTLTFGPQGQTCITYADASGVWSCKLDQALSLGSHTLSVSALTPAGVLLTLPTYRIEVVANRQSIAPSASAVQPFRINSSYQYQVYAYGQSTSLALSISGGTSPYAMSIDWGDGTVVTVLRNDRSLFTITHVYRPHGVLPKDYVIKVQAVDATGAKAFLQTSAVVWGGGGALHAPAGTCQAGSATSNPCPTAGSFLSHIKRWLWIVWPTYAVLVLMVFSFWLGERQELLLILGKKPPGRQYRT